MTAVGPSVCKTGANSAVTAEHRLLLYELHSTSGAKGCLGEIVMVQGAPVM